MQNEEENEPINWRCWMRTLFAASGPMMMYVIFGIMQAQTAIMLPELEKSDSYIRVTPNEGTWIASLGVAPAPISALIVGPAIDKIGRKKGILFFFIVMGTGFGLIACAREVWHLYMGRIIIGWGFGLNVTGTVYLSEVCTNKQRGLFLSILGALCSFGGTLAFILNFLFPWNIASAIYSLTCFVYFIIMCFIPESPAWLFRQSNLEASSSSLHKLGRSQLEISRELELLELSTKEGKKRFELRALLEPTAWKPFVILSVFHLLNCLAGGYYTLYYTIDLIERLGTTYSPLTLGAVMSVVKVLANFTIGLYFTAYVRRRFATALSAFCMAVTSGGAGVYEYMYRDVSVSDRPLCLLPAVLLCTNIAVGIIGATTLPWLLIGEVFPLRIRGAMTGSMYVVGTILMFVCIKIYGFFMETLDIWGLLILEAAASFLTILLGIFFVPETLNKTLYEVEQSFISEKKKQET